MLVLRQGRLNSAMSSLAADHDREVCAAAQAVSDLYKRVPVRMAGSSGRATSDSLGAQQLYDAADAAKEAAEADNLLDPQDLERSAAQHVPIFKSLHDPALLLVSGPMPLRGSGLTALQTALWGSDERNNIKHERFATFIDAEHRQGDEQTRASVMQVWTRTECFAGKR